jgi:hypothetical protein
MILELTHPLTEMSTKNLSEGEGRSARKADILTAICEPTVKKMRELRRSATVWTSTACYRDSFTFLYFIDRILGVTDQWLQRHCWRKAGKVGLLFD